MVCVPQEVAIWPTRLLLMLTESVLLLCMMCWLFANIGGSLPVSALFGGLQAYQLIRVVAFFTLDNVSR